MKTLSLAWMFMFFSTTLSESNPRESLSIIIPLTNSSGCPGDGITLYCDIKHATSYAWFKDGKRLKGRRRKNFNISWNKLNIHKLNGKKHVGSYECEGSGSNNKTLRTKAWIKMDDQSCCPQENVYSKCVPFIAAKCPPIDSYAPAGTNLKTLIRIYELDIAYDIPTRKYIPALAISWEVPKQGKDDIWGWRIDVFGISSNNAGYQQCYQINRARKSIVNIDVENLIVLLLTAGATYKVSVQSLPSMDDEFNKTVVSNDVTIPNRCELLGSELLPCCQSYINASLGSDKNNRTTLYWTTQYPPNLNISIDKFIILWKGENETCDYSSIVLGSNKTNYTFTNLKESCGSYTIIIDATLLHPGIECPVSTLEKKLLYIPEPPTEPAKEKPVDKKTTLKIVIALSSCIVAALLVAMYIIKWRKKTQSNSSVLPPGDNNNETQSNSPLLPPGGNNNESKVFILHPGHCKECENVIHSLGTLLHTTGYIKCNIDMWVPKGEMVRGPQQWINEMIEENNYVLIPWFCQIDDQLPRKGTGSTGIINFNHGLRCKAGMIAGDTNKNGKFFNLKLDNSSINFIPNDHKVCHTFHIPSQIDELVMELIGQTRRQPGSINEFPNVSYKEAKTDLINNIKRCHPDSLMWKCMSGKV